MTQVLAATEWTRTTGAATGATLTAMTEIAIAMAAEVMTDAATMDGATGMGAGTGMGIVALGTRTMVKAAGSSVMGSGSGCLSAASDSCAGDGAGLPFTCYPS